MKKININQIDPQILLGLIEAVFADYTASFNNINPERRVNFTTSLTPAKISTYDVLLKQGKFSSKEEMEKQGIVNEVKEVRYLRVGKYFEKVSFYTPIIEEFKPGFIFQKLDPIGKVWEEMEFEQGDTPPVQEALDNEEYRVAKVTREREVAIHQQSITLKDKRELLNDKWWKRILYLDLINTLMAKGIEYGEVLGLLQRGEEEKAVLAKELGENAKQVLEANQIVIRKEMPAPLTKEDEEYKAQMQKLRDKEDKK